MGRPKVKAKTKPFTMQPVCPPGHRHRSYSGVISRMVELGICSEERAKTLQQNVDGLVGEESE